MFTTDLVTVTGTAGSKARTLGFTGLDVAKHALELEVVDDRANSARGV